MLAHLLSHHIGRHICRHHRHVSHAMQTIHQSFHVMEVAFSLVCVMVVTMSSGMRAAKTQSIALPINTTLSYPLTQIVSPTCRATNATGSRDQFPDSCRIALPIISKARYTDFVSKPDYKSIYTVLRGATYQGQRDMDAGDHPGVDIATVRGTPIYSIANGIVTHAGRQNGYGNVVKVQFRIGGTIYHAVYAHMDTIAVAKGDTIAQGTQIGTLGNSGNTFGALGGYHLHLEIDMDNGGRPAYYFAGCPAMQETKSEMKIIGEGTCRSYREQYQVDPIAFIEGYRNGTTLAAIHPVASSDAREPVVTPDPKPIKTVKETPKETIKPTPKLAPMAKVSFVSARSMDISAMSVDVLDFYQRYDIQVIHTDAGDTGKIKLVITNKTDGTPFVGPLPAVIGIVPYQGYVSLSQTMIEYMEAGVATLTYTTKPQSDTVIISLDGQTYATVDV